MTEFLLKGLDGTNPLGFLAAVGTLRTSATAWSDNKVKMRWTVKGGSWRPALVFENLDMSQDHYLDVLNSELKKKLSHSAFGFAENLPIPFEDYAEQANSAFFSVEKSDREFADFISAFGSEAVVDKDNRMSDTAFRALGGGQTRFLKTMVQLVEATEADHLREALFETWSYSDDKPSMRWDPADDRRHALRWKEPTKDPVKTVRGANRLAIEALPLHPTMPTSRRLETTGFTRKRGRGEEWSWPLWEPPVTVDVARSLLSLAELQKERPDRGELLRMGIREVMRCQRITTGKYRNFTPARPV